jgi:hypothetical protein
VGHERSFDRGAHVAPQGNGGAAAGGLMVLGLLAAHAVCRRGAAKGKTNSVACSAKAHEGLGQYGDTTSERSLGKDGYDS